MEAATEGAKNSTTKWRLEEETVVLLAKRSLQRAHQQIHRDTTALNHVKKSLDGERKEYLKRCQAEKNLLEKKMRTPRLSADKVNSRTRSRESADQAKGSGTVGCNVLLKRLKNYMSSHLIGREKKNEPNDVRGKVDSTKLVILRNTEEKHKKENRTKKGSGPTQPTYHERRRATTVPNKLADIENDCADSMDHLKRSAPTQENYSSSLYLGNANHENGNELEEKPGKISSSGKEKSSDLVLPKIIVTPPSVADENVRRHTGRTGKGYLVRVTSKRRRLKTNSEDLENLLHQTTVTERKKSSAKTGSLLSVPTPFSKESRRFPVSSDRSENTNHTFAPSKTSVDKYQTKTTRYSRGRPEQPVLAHFSRRPLLVKYRDNDFQRNPQILAVLGIVNIKVKKDSDAVRVLSAPPSSRFGSATFGRRT